MERPVSKTAYWDNLKGIFIFLVVFAHCLYSLQDSALINRITDLIYVFHMPAFVFVAGFLSKSENARSKSSLKKLIVAYIIFNPLMLLYAYVRYGIMPTLVTPSYSYWFLIGMIVWRFSVKYVSRVRGALVFSVAAALIVGFFADVTNVFSAARIIAFYPFFLAGFMLPAEKISVLYDKRKAYVYIEGVILLAVAVAASYLFVVVSGVSDGALTMTAYENRYGLLMRTAMFAISAAAITGFMLAVPNRRIPCLTTLGSNSMSVFLLHRIPTLLIGDLLIGGNDAVRITGSAVAAVLLTALLGNRAVAFRVDGFLTFCRGLVSGESVKTTKKSIVVRTLLCVAVVVVALLPLASELNNSFRGDSESKSESDSAGKIYNRITDAQQAAFDDDIKILFSGDLILLEDQVKNAYDGEKYDFGDIFEYTEKYISGADLAIGVFEGPAAGAEKGYSVGNYDDGKSLSLNFPDEFVQSVKNAGYDLVTTANNHLLDKGISGALRTLDVLDSFGLDHIGSYRNASEKETVKILSAGGIKIAVLAYTYGSNGYSEDDLLSGGLSYITSVLVPPKSVNFEKVKASVIGDIGKAKKEEPDLIVILPHMGEQFLDEPDDYQKAWNDIFIGAGADIVLNDHTHSVQPVDIFGENGKNKLIVNCPGNFVNIYRKHNGDAAVMVEVYIDRKDKTVTGASVIPMWIQSPAGGNYRPLPIYDILCDETLKRQISTDDLERVGGVHRHITSVMLGEELTLDMVEERYYMNENGYLAPQTEQMELTDAMKASVLYKAVTTAESVCYVGDSLTEGNTNGGYGWYEPVSGLSKKSVKCAKGGGTSKTILPQIPAGYGLYVVAIGTNDVRYRKSDICAMTAEEYIKELEKFVSRIRATDENAKFAFVAPWMALETDRVSALPPVERDAMLAEYTSSLKTWCSENGHIFSNPNPAIAGVLAKEKDSDYILDHIHPNRTSGIKLYSKSVFENSTR